MHELLIKSTIWKKKQHLAKMKLQYIILLKLYFLKSFFYDVVKSNCYSNISFLLTAKNAISA